MYKEEKNLISYYNSLPHGGTTIKTKKAVKQIFDLLEIKLEPSSLILDLGCASGVVADFMRELFASAVIGVDISVERILVGKEKRPKTLYVNMDIYHFAKQTQLLYDLVVLFDVLEHLHNPVRLLNLCKKITETIVAKIPLDHIDKAHLQIFKSKEHFDCLFSPDKSVILGKNLLAKWRYRDGFNKYSS